MKRLRHPIRAIREPFGTAGLIIACLALVAALGGTALAAAKLNSTQKKEVEKIAKKFAGKPGTTGANGTNGINGAAGPKGENGAAGGAGAKGENGVSVTTVAIPKTPSKCSNQGGVEVKSASAPVNVCNGTTGFTETLPAGQTETGTWAANGTEIVALPFAIPLESGPSLSAHFIETNESDPPGCAGTITAPEAEPGNLCVFQGQGFEFGTLERHVILGPGGGSSIGGPGAQMEIEFEGEGLAAGSFAVTARTE